MACVLVNQCVERKTRAVETVARATCLVDGVYKAMLIFDFVIHMYSPIPT